MADETPTTPIASVISTQPTVADAVNPLIAQIEAAGLSELEALKPQIGVIVRKFAANYEAQLSGITGVIERHVINAIVDAIFGPAA